jgi:two-component system response regulator YesN
VLNRLLSGLQQEDENRLGFLGLSFPLSGCSYLVMAAGIEGRAGGEEYELSLIAVKNEVERILSAGYCHVSFQDEGGRLILLAWHEREEVIYRDSLFEAEEIGRVLFRYISLPVTVGIGEPASAVQLIPRSYGEALRALSFGAIQGGGRVVTYRELVGGTSGPRKSPANWGRHIANALKVSSRGDVARQIDDMVAAFRTGYFSPEEYYVTLQMTLAAILQAAEDFEIQRDEIFRKGADPFAEVRAESSLEETREWFLSLCWRILDAFSRKQENFSRNKIREAQTYIENRYSDPSLSLRSVCKDLSISMSYFSLMFKKYLGKTFIEFLTEIRIEKAKELLRNTNMKTYEIARCIGYRDAHYFSLIFRKTAGEPPSVYRTGNKDETAKD